MPLAEFFLYTSVAVGLFQLIDAWLLLKASGKPSLWVMTFSAFELVWAALALYLIWGGATAAPLPFWLPASFVLYAATSTAIGVAIAAKPPFDEMKPLPDWLIVGCGAFGVYFFLASLYILRG